MGEQESAGWHALISFSSAARERARRVVYKARCWLWGVRGSAGFGSF